MNEWKVKWIFGSCFIKFNDIRRLSNLIKEVMVKSYHAFSRVHSTEIRLSFVQLFYQVKRAQNKIAVSLSVDQQRRQEVVLHRTVK